MGQTHELRVRQKRLTAEEREQLVRNLNTQFQDPDAQTELKQEGIKVRGRIEQLRRQRELDPRELRRPFTV